MSECKKFRAYFAESLYRELDMERKKSLEEHLAGCPDCFKEYGEMAGTLKIMREKKVPDPGQEFWDGYWDRLERRMKSEGLTGNGVDAVGPAPERKFFHRRAGFFQRWTYGMAGAAALLAAGILIGRYFISRPQAVAQKPAQESSARVQPAAGADLRARTSQYFDRSKVVLLALLNFDPKTKDLYGLNIPLQKKRSRELVQEAALLRKDLGNSNQKRLEDLVSDLEMILMQLANLESENDLSAVEMVKLGVESKGVLFGINLSEMKQVKSRSRRAPSPNMKITKF